MKPQSTLIEILRKLVFATAALMLVNEAHDRVQKKSF